MQGSAGGSSLTVRPWPLDAERLSYHIGPRSLLSRAVRVELCRLEAFLDLLPPRAPTAFEFRHESWFDDDVIGVLREKGCALCLADTDDGDQPSMVNTGSLGYLRLRRADYSDDDLRSWADRIHEQAWDRAFVFFKHEDEAAGPRMAQRFLELVPQGPEAED